MAAANNEFFEALSMLEHERGITAEGSLVSSRHSSTLP